MACASTTKAVWLFLLSYMLLVHNADATIKIVGGDSEFLSRPDNYVGMGMKAGIKYPARIQKVHGDEHLCKGNLIHVNVPEDGRPGTCCCCLFQKHLNRFGIFLTVLMKYSFLLVVSRLAGKERLLFVRAEGRVCLYKNISSQRCQNVDH